MWLQCETCNILKNIIFWDSKNRWVNIILGSFSDTDYSSALRTNPPDGSEKDGAAAAWRLFNAGI